MCPPAERDNDLAREKEVTQIIPHRPEATTRTAWIMSFTRQLGGGKVGTRRRENILQGGQREWSIWLGQEVIARSVGQDLVENDDDDVILDVLAWLFQAFHLFGTFLVSPKEGSSSQARSARFVQCPSRLQLLTLRQL